VDSVASILIQMLNGLQYGLLLFLVASGLTLIFGIMGVINLAHGSFYMIGAYLAWSLASQFNSLLAAIVVGVVLSVGLGLLLERLLIRHFYHRDHLYQVLLTYGLILIFEQLRSIIWGDDVQGVIGSFQSLLLNGVTPATAHSLAPGLPEYLWIAYQLTFAIITPALIAGAFAERIKYSGLLLFTGLWTLLVYAPICHWVWGGGFLCAAGVLDFAGGAVVHVNAGVAGLVCAIFLGARKGYGTESIVAHNPVLTMIGASLLLVGWIGFNAGSAWTADSIASVALLNTILAAMAGSLTWKIVEIMEKRKPSLIGVLSGLIAGLVAITPAAGLVDPKGAVIIGLASGPVCYAASVWIKKLLRYDDSLDAFGIHGAGGILGAVLTGVFASAAVNGVAEGATVAKQVWGLGVTIGWSAVVTFLILIVCKYTTGLRVTAEQEQEGLDGHLHGEVMEGV
jgi:Amt family ammonium transporter